MCIIIEVFYLKVSSMCCHVHMRDFSDVLNLFWFFLVHLVHCMYILSCTDSFLH